MALRPPHLRSRRRSLTVAAGIVVVVAAVTSVAVALALGHGPQGASSPDSAVTQYLAALNAGDRAKLAEIADPDYLSGPELDPVIERLGHGRFVVTATAINSTAADGMNSATLTGTLNQAPYTDTIWLRRHGTRWYVAIGPNRSSSTKGIRSS